MILGASFAQQVTYQPQLAYKISRREVIQQMETREAERLSSGDFR